MAQVYGKRWEVQSSLGEGGQAHTFLVKDLQGAGQTSYVLKRLKNPERLTRFKREIEAISNLNHTHVLKIKDFMLDTDKPFMVTEYCQGGPLTKTVETGAPPLETAFKLFIQICEGVAHAHQNEIIHRDLKPDNIFIRLPNNDAVVGDFGICYFQGEEARLTHTEEAVGPRLFIAPELEDGRNDQVSSSCDIYSLGKVLYWLLVGGHVFSREKFREERWDLKRLVQHPFLYTENVYMEHVTRLFEHMIVAEPHRRGAMPDIIKSTRRIQKLIELQKNPVSRTLPQVCTYCGWGVYKEVASGSGANVQNFGFKVTGNADWRVLACEECGHIDLFRVDLAKDNNWWEIDKRP